MTDTNPANYPDTLKEYLTKSISQCDDYSKLHELRIDCNEAILKSARGFAIASHLASNVIMQQINNTIDVDKNELRNVSRILDSHSYLLDLLLTLEHESAINLIKQHCKQD